MRKIHDRLWVHEQRVIGIADGLRMTVVVLDDGSLWVHSPTPLTAALSAAIDALGPVDSLVAPNNHHHKSLRQWRDAYPAAKLYVAPAIPRKQKWLDQYTLLERTDPGTWAGALDVQSIAGAPYFSETVFYHRVSRSLIVTDLIQNHVAAAQDSARVRVARKVLAAFGFNGACTAPPLKLSWVRTDPNAFATALKRVMAWKVDRIVVSHGATIEAHASDVLHRLFAPWIVTSEAAEHQSES